ncbi:MAG TPA: hypothetical protein VIV15_04775 [Anaerolineales bacterium]
MSPPGTLLDSLPNIYLARPDIWQAQRWRSSFIAIAVALGLLSAYLSRSAMNPDGLSYLDLADAFARGDWRTATNGLWSPLYPALVGIVLAILRPPPVWEFPVVHLANFLLYLVALAAFDWFLRQVLLFRTKRVGHSAWEGRVLMPEWALWALGYALFLWVSLDLITLWLVTPDMMVAACVFLATGLLVRILSEPRRWMDYALLGLTLGLGFLAKAPMLPMAAVYFALALLMATRRADWRIRVPRVVPAVVVFAVIIAPFVVELSAKEGHYTVGESGKLNYAWWINGVAMIHWQGNPPGSGKPRHPTRRVLADPPLYEFATPISSTYPPWFDPTYWMKGVTPRFDLRGHVRVFRVSLRTIYRRIFKEQVGLIAGGAFLIYAGGRRWSFLRDVTQQASVLILPSLIGVALFSLIHLEPRFIASFVAVFWLGIFVSVTVNGSGGAQRVMTGAVKAIAILILLPVVIRTGNLAALSREGNVQWQVATRLHDLGLRPGARVGFIGWTYGAYWARLGRFRIVAEIPDQGLEMFLQASAPRKNTVLSTLAGTGAEAVVLRTDTNPGEGWQEIRNTGYYVFLTPP